MLVAMLVARLLRGSERVVARGAEIAYANRNAAYYALGFIAAFALAYWLIGLERHFNVPDYIDKKDRGSFFNSVYTSIMSQSNAMSDFVPRTNLARALLIMQVASGWAWFLLFNNEV